VHEEEQKAVVKDVYSTATGMGNMKTDDFEKHIKDLLL